MQFSTKDTKWAFLFVLIAITATAWLMFGASTLPDKNIPWELITNYDSFFQSVDAERIGLLSFENYSDIFLKTEQLTGGLPQMPTWSYWLLLGAWVFAIASIFALASEFSSQVYYIFLALALVLIYGLRLDVHLEFLPQHPFFSYLIPLCLAAPSLVSYILGKTWAFTPRFLAYLAYGAGLAFLAYYFQTKEGEAATLAIYRAFPSLLLFFGLSSLFIAQEIPAFFAELTSRRASSKKGSNLWSFVLISILYTATIFLFYLDSIGYLAFKMAFFSPFILFPISVLLGLRSLPFRLQSTGQRAEAVPIRMLYCALLGLIFSLLAFVFLSNNDLLLEALEDIIMQTHIAAGLFFSIYMIINFVAPFWENKPVYKVMYKPYQMGTWLLFITIGLSTMVLFLGSNITAYYQWMAGKLGQEAQIHLKNNAPQRAKPLLELALGYTSRGNSHHYLLGRMSHQERELGQSYFHFREAQEKNQTTQAAISLIRNYRLRDRFFEAKSLAEEGYKHTAEPAFAFVLGTLYMETQLLDSAAFYLTEAKRGANVMAMAARTNLGAIVARVNRQEVRQSWGTQVKPEDDVVNWSAARQEADLGLGLSQASNLADTFAVINNFLHHNLGLPDKTLKEGLLALSETWIFPYYKEKIRDKLTESFYRAGYIKPMLDLQASLLKPEVAEHETFRSKAIQRSLAYRKFAHSRRLIDDQLTEADSRQQDLLITLQDLHDFGIGSIENYAPEIQAKLGLSSIDQNNDTSTYWQVWRLAERAPLTNLETLTKNIKNQDLQMLAFYEVARALFLSAQLERLHQWVWLESWQSLIQLDLLVKIRHDVAFLKGEKSEGVGVLWPQRAQDDLAKWRIASVEIKKETLAGVSAHVWQEGVIIQLAQELEDQNLKQEAYQVLLQAHLAHEQGIEILKAYIRLSQSLNYNSFALVALRKLEPLVSSSAYMDFINSLD